MELNLPPAVNIGYMITQKETGSYALIQSLLQTKAK